MFIDSHAHLYAKEFDMDRLEMVNRALAAGVNKLLLPNIDEESISSMHDLCNKYPKNCFAMMGLHPCSVTKDFTNQLAEIHKHLDASKHCGVGEIGIDLYWDKSLIEEQKAAFSMQIEWAKELELPIAIHTRDSFNETLELVHKLNSDKLTGVFHCFGGTTAEGFKVIDEGFMLGIGGVLTFKNSTLRDELKDIPLEYLILETDAPYLTPAPFRGKRNESSYIPIIAEELAKAKGITVEEVAEVTTQNAQKLFNV
jgi:TatD DNase family protein